ncbi:MAG: ParA family protein [Deltaproteobacteria bacterium]|nr:ParA family protein [Deltaproteobacteria bacterium]
MGKIICVANQKGGVGKTTTVVNLSASLAAAHKKSIFIDFDPQGNATSGVGIDKERVEKSIYNAIIGEVSIRETILELELQILKGYLSVAPSNSSLTGAEIELIYLERREWRLKDIIEPIINEYEYIFIDSPPSLSLLTVNALTAADSVIIPVQCEYYAMEGLGQLKRTISLIKQRLNPNIEIEGYLLTMFDPRNRICHVVANEVTDFFKDRVFQTRIPRNVRLAESPSHGKPVLLYDSKSIGAESYLSLAREIIARHGGERFEESYFG